MKFTKMQGLGNDYVYVNCLQEKIDNPSELARKISNRHFGVGSDGLILRWRCTMRMDRAVRCVGMGYAVWQSMFMITV